MAYVSLQLDPETGARIDEELLDEETREEWILEAVRQRLAAESVSVEFVDDCAI